MWLKAREAGGLNKAQLVVAQKAEILMRGLAQVGIVALVDEAREARAREKSVRLRASATGKLHDSFS